jgi:hypothetical protein
MAKEKPGITNRPASEEAAGQARVDEQADRLPDIEAVNRPRKDHPMDKDKESDVASSGRISETGAGRGTDHTGH